MDNIFYHATLKMRAFIMLFFLSTKNISAQEQALCYSIRIYFEEIKAATKTNYSLWHKNLF